MDRVLESLAQYDWRIAGVYPSARAILEANKPDYIWTYHTPMVETRTVSTAIIQAPEFVYKINNEYRANSTSAQPFTDTNPNAPVGGIYTGIPSGCNASGNGSPL